MWKSVGLVVLRCGAVWCLFGVFGVLFMFLPWFRPTLRRRGQPPDDSAG